MKCITRAIITSELRGGDGVRGGRSRIGLGLRRSFVCVFLAQLHGVVLYSTAGQQLFAPVSVCVLTRVAQIITAVRGDV